jgi:phosphatidylserine decarboxylase
MSGRIKRVHYRPGKFVSANLDKASEDNERTAISMTTDEGRDIAFVQVAGLVARRIVCKLREGDHVVIGQRFGLIRFGSRTDVYLPPEWTPLAIVGQRMVGGETVIADSRAQEPARQGIEH